jgi:hypothetical protein
MVGREGFEPSTIGLKARDFRYIYLFFIILNRGVRCLKCSTVHNGAALSPAKLPQAFSASRLQLYQQSKHHRPRKFTNTNSISIPYIKCLMGESGLTCSLAMIHFHSYGVAFKYIDILSKEVI